VIDTPGVIDKGNIINYVDSKELRKIVSKGEIRPRSMQIKRKGSILIDDYVRIDYVTKIDNSLVVYVPSSVDVKFNSRKNDKLLYYSLFDYNIDNNKDIVIPGLGFIKFTKNIDIKMYILDGVIPYVRDNLI
jgi:hypothetical protein